MFTCMELYSVQKAADMYCAVNKLGQVHETLLSGEGRGSFSEFTTIVIKVSCVPIISGFTKKHFLDKDLN